MLLKQALPRLHKDIIAYFKIHNSQYIEQINQLRISDWCDCGSEHCFNMYFEGVSGLRPLYYDMHNLPIAISYGLSSGGIITGFEISSDYADGYIRNFLSTVLQKQYDI